MSEPASTTPPSQATPPKQRHGCLTAYLAFIMIANSVTSIMYLTGAGGLRENAPNLPEWALPILILLGIVNLVCAAALFGWKKWGFWGFACSAAIAFIVNLSIVVDPVSAASGLLGVAILFGVLHIGKERKGWTQLE